MVHLGLISTLEQNDYYRSRRLKARVSGNLGARPADPVQWTLSLKGTDDATRGPSGPLYSRVHCAPMPFLLKPSAHPLAAASSSAHRKLSF